MLNFKPESCPVKSVRKYYETTNDILDSNSDDAFKKAQKSPFVMRDLHSDLKPTKEALYNVCQQIEADMARRDTISGAKDIMQEFRELLPAKVFLDKIMQDDKVLDKSLGLDVKLNNFKIEVLEKMIDQLKTQSVDTTNLELALENVQKKLSDTDDVFFVAVEMLKDELEKVQSNLAGQSLLKDFYLLDAWLYAFEARLVVDEGRKEIIQLALEAI